MYTNTNYNKLLCLLTSPAHFAAKQYIPPVHPLLYALVAESVSTGSHAAAIDAAHAYGAEKVVVDRMDLKERCASFRKKTTYRLQSLTGILRGRSSTSSVFCLSKEGILSRDWPPCAIAAQKLVRSILKNVYIPVGGSSRAN